MYTVVLLTVLQHQRCHDAERNVLVSACGFLAGTQRAGHQLQHPVPKPARKAFRRRNLRHHHFDLHLSSVWSLSVLDFSSRCRYLLCCLS